jgi:hypothetical protein
MKRLAFGLFLSLAAAACTSRSIVGVQDHPTQNLTALQVRAVTNYLFSISIEHVFYSCADNGTDLVCKRLCGGQTDLQCPAATAGAGWAATNVR